MLVHVLVPGDLKAPDEIPGIENSKEGHLVGLDEFLPLDIDALTVGFP
jgi:hypothetical protein